MSKIARQPKLASEEPSLDDLLEKFENIGDVLYLYEHHMRCKPLAEWRTWPDISIDQLVVLARDENFNISMLDDMPAELARSHRATFDFFARYRPNKGLPDPNFRKLFMETKCELGFAVPLLIDLVGSDNLKNSDRLALIYAWANCLRHMNRKQWQETFTKSVAEDKSVFEFDIECTLDQANILSMYLLVRARAYNAWNKYVAANFPRQRSQSAPLPGSTFITDFKLSQNVLGVKIPRSLVVRSMSHCTSEWQRWSDATKKKGAKPKDLDENHSTSFSVASSGFNFASSCTALTVGEAKKMHIVADTIVGSLDVSRPVKYLVVTRKEGLVFSVKGKYKD